MTGPDSSQSSSNTSGGASEGRGGVRKRWWFWVLYAVVLIVLVGFTVYFYQRVRSPQGREESSDPSKSCFVRRGYGRIGPQAPPPTTGPSEMTDNPLAGVAMTPLDGNPGGLAPPTGAVRQSAFVRRTGGEVEMMARYTSQGSADQAAEYYRKYLGGKGMKFLGEQTRAGRSASSRPNSLRYARPRRIFVFHGPKRHVTVMLREMPGNDKTLSITLNLVYPNL
ncbi:MAG: hypothetical protein ISS69_00735 [Phycisphaerae bacterium]|nr:hypothetical protein [Phycisphaerae bacterium]